MAFPRTVFFDESGYTGQNLNDLSQPFFVYAGLIIEADAARDYLDAWVAKHRIPRDKNGEVKVTSLITSRDCRRHTAIAELITDLGSAAWVAVFEKSFCLAAKFFEYTFDPILLPKMGLFHALRFPQFLANLVHMYAQNQSAVEQLLTDFAALVRRDTTDFEAALPLVAYDPQDPIDCIRIILANNRRTVIEHVEYSKQLPFGKWLLDLTTTALFTLLMQIGNSTLLRVICDESKPLAADTSAFDALVGRTESVEYVVNGMRLGTVSLSEPVVPRPSRSEAGLQLADIIAGATAKAVKTLAVGGKSPFGNALDDIRSVKVGADITEVDLQRREAQVNLMLLTALADRSGRGVDLLDGIEDFISIVSEPEFSLIVPR